MTFKYTVRHRTYFNRIRTTEMDQVLFISVDLLNTFNGNSVIFCSFMI